MRGEISNAGTIVVDAGIDSGRQAAEVLTNGTITLDGQGWVYPPTSAHSVIGQPGREYAFPILKNVSEL